MIVLLKVSKARNHPTSDSLICSGCWLSRGWLNSCCQSIQSSIQLWRELQGLTMMCCPMVSSTANAYVTVLCTQHCYFNYICRSLREQMYQNSSTWDGNGQFGADTQLIFCCLRPLGQCAHIQQGFVLRTHLAERASRFGYFEFHAHARFAHTWHGSRAMQG